MGAERSDIASLHRPMLSQNDRMTSNQRAAAIVRTNRNISWPMVITLLAYNHFARTAHAWNLLGPKFRNIIWKRMWPGYAETERVVFQILYIWWA